MWNDLTTVKKGNIGERIVKQALEKAGYIVYVPTTHGSHKIDFFAHRGTQKEVICCEVKTKPRMKHTHETGFDLIVYEHYKSIYEKYKIPVFVAFVDEFEECVYGNWLHKLKEPRQINHVVVWPLCRMIKLFDLSPSQLAEIRQHTRSNYDYTHVCKYFNCSF